MSHVIAIDIGGTKIAGALVSDSGDLTPAPVASLPTPKTGGEDVAATVVEMVRMVRQAAGSAQPLAVGIGSAGVIDPAGRRIVSATDAIPGWGGTELAEIVEAASGLPVFIENDVHAHARGEMWKGAGRGRASALMVAVGTGIGGAIIQGGQILRGARGLAGHVGHLPASVGQERRCSCGKTGHIEAIAAGPAMTSWYNDQLAAGGGAGQAPGAPTVPGVAAVPAVGAGEVPAAPAARRVPVADGRELFDRARHGDELAQQVVQTAGYATGEVIAGLVNALDPEIVIFGGGLAEAGDPYWPAVEEGYRNQLMPALAEVPLVVAELKTGAALLGAAALAWAQLDA